jgi:mono/diheme cytochrome c family protein
VTGIVLSLVLGGAIVERASAQAKPAGTAKPPASAAKTTLSGIYTKAQAVKGEETYFNMCVNCHPKGYYAGQSFKNTWNNRPLWDLWDWISNKMPKNDPGSLTPAEVVQIMAYILQQNKMPAGTVALPPNEKTLYGIKIQIK